MSTLLDALICPARTSQVAIVEVIKSMRLWRCKIEGGEYESGSFKGMSFMVGGVGTLPLELCSESLLP